LVLTKRRFADGRKRWFPSGVSIPYEEILDGNPLPPVRARIRHEQICERLHAAMAASVANIGSTPIACAAHENPGVPLHHHLSRPGADHRGHRQNSGWLWRLSTRAIITPTRSSKRNLRTVRVPRLWMVDPRYDNVEIYHSTEFGLALKGILAGGEVLAEKAASGIPICHRRTVRHSPGE